jgi:hypothetical protein
MIGKSIYFLPREAGEGDHAKRGGGGLGKETCSAVDACPYRRDSLATSLASGGGKKVIA